MQVFQQRITDEEEFQKRQAKYRKEEATAFEVELRHTHAYTHTHTHNTHTYTNKHVPPPIAQVVEEWDETKAAAAFEKELKKMKEEKVDTHFEPGTGKFKQLYYKEKFKEFFEAEAKGGKKVPQRHSHFSTHRIERNHNIVALKITQVAESIRDLCEA